MQQAVRTDTTALAGPWLGERSFRSWRDEFDQQGFVVFQRVLKSDQIEDLRAALAPHLDQNLKGRNNFEGTSTNRVYALLAKSPVFADLAIHPLALAFAEAELGETCLLSACLAINLQPGETVQPWHFDDGSIAVKRPRPSFGVSAFWAINETTALNGATQVIPGSHLWGPEPLGGQGDRDDAVCVAMPAGSLMLTKGTLWHRGGANRSACPRLIITPQYCPGWARPLETMTLAVPAQTAASLPERARELLGYSILPPFMGYVDGMHPGRVLPGQG